MTAPHWIDGLRLVALAGMSYGLWRSYKNRPPKLRHAGKTYYALPDGRFATAWGRVLKDQAVIDALRAATPR